MSVPRVSFVQRELPWVGATRVPERTILVPMREFESAGRRMPTVTVGRRDLVASSNATWCVVACAALVVVPAVAVTLAQSVYPTGTTIYDPARAWNGFTVLSPLAGEAVLVIDMNGNVVKRWEGLN